MTASFRGVSPQVSIVEIKPNSPCVNRSSVSRHWKASGSKLVEQLRSKDLGETTWCALMHDGIRLSKELTAVVASGIVSNGNKQV